MTARILHLFAAVLAPTAEDIYAALHDCQRGAIDEALRDLVASGQLRRDGAAYRVAR